MINVNIQTEPFTAHNIRRVRGDTKKILVKLSIGQDIITPVDITSWTNFYLTVDPSKAPINEFNNIEQMIGVIEDATEGVVSFSPSPDTPAGSYYFDIQATDEDGGISTLVMGKYDLIQDITKD